MYPDINAPALSGRSNNSTLDNRQQLNQTMHILNYLGSHPRHLYVVNKLAELGIVTPHVMEVRGSFVPAPSAGLEAIDQENFISHYADCDEAEHRHFVGNERVNFELPTLKVSMQGLNSPEPLSG